MSESLDLQGHRRWALGGSFDWQFQPLVTFDENDEDTADIIENMMTTHFGASVVLHDRVRLGLTLPFSFSLGGEAGTTLDGPVSATEGVSLGDERLGVDVRIFGKYGDPFTAASGLQMHIPSGNPEAFTGDGQVRVVWRALMAGQLSTFEYATRLGFNIRTRGGEFAGVSTGSEAQLGLAAGMRFMEGALLVGPELFGSTVVTDGDAFFGRVTSPLELLLGSRYAFRENWRAGLAFSTGLNRGVGSPAGRVIMTVDWLTAPADVGSP